MDFLDPKKTRNHRIRLFIGYGLMSLLIVLITTLLAYFAYGYNVTLDGEVDQRGLVFVSSQPSGSQIAIDGKRVGSTGARLVVSSGSRELRISRTGYHDWVRTIDVRGSSVSHFTYPFLIPTSLTTNDVTPYDAPLLLATQSPDRRWLITQTAGVDTFELFDLNRNQATVAQTTSIMLDDGLLSAGTTTSWEAVDWAGNNRHALLLRSYTNAQNATATEYILLDRQRPAGSHNLTRELQLDAQVVVSLRDKKPDSYYLYNQESKLLSSASLDNPAPIAILENVLAYAFHDTSRILYATTSTENPDMVDVLLKEGNASYVLRTIPVGETYLLNIARYDSAWYVALGVGEEGKVYIYKNPIAALKNNSDKRPMTLSVLTVENATSVEFSNNTRFVAVQNGSGVHVYDFEESEDHRFTLQHPLDAPQTVATWMDGHRLTYVSGGKQYMVDYDNTNERELVAASSTFLPIFSGNYRYVYNFTDSEAQLPVLQSTALRTPADL